jgi:hypothetical protein
MQVQHWQNDSLSHQVSSPVMVLVAELPVALCLLDKLAGEALPRAPGSRVRLIALCVAGGSPPPLVHPKNTTRAV